jgi:hypothetical protein
VQEWARWVGRVRWKAKWEKRHVLVKIGHLSSLLTTCSWNQEKRCTLWSASVVGPQRHVLSLLEDRFNIEVSGFSPKGVVLVSVLYFFVFC